MTIKEQLLTELNEKLLVDPTELIGRKIVAAYEGYPETLYLRLEDDRFFMVQAKPSYDHTALLEVKGEVDAWEDFDDLVRLGVMSKTALEQYEAETEDYRVKRQLAQERAQYEALKKKFEN